MWVAETLIAASALAGVNIVNAAINLDGTHAFEPASDNDPSPINDVNAFDVDYHDCPLPCADYANPHSWIPYLSVGRLRRCKEPMLLQLSVTQQTLNGSEPTALIRSCSLASNSTLSKLARRDTSFPSSPTTVVQIENPKKDRSLAMPQLETAEACFDPGSKVILNLPIATSNGTYGAGNASQVASLLQLMTKFFHTKDNCDENFIYAYHQQVIAGIYIGAGLGKPTVESGLKAFASQLESSSIVANLTTVEFCRNGQAERTFGVAIDMTGDLAAVQKTTSGWSRGTCASMDKRLRETSYIQNVPIWDISGPPNSTTSRNGTLLTASRPFSRMTGLLPGPNTFKKRDVCRHVKVDSGDGCAVLAAKCGISDADFYKHNPAKNLCSTLRPGDYVCCSPGNPYHEPKPEPPKQDADGTCATHLIQAGDSCASIAKRYGVTVDNLEQWNKGKTWAWANCQDMIGGYNMCVSDGSAPLPPPQQGTQCGPLVPGTKKPRDSSVSLADLNPCPLKACCSNWGFCGVFPAHCSVHTIEGGGPGSKPRSVQNTCVSNCGTDIKTNSGPPSSFQRIGYYEAFGLKRDCLWLNAKDANTDGSYTHIHWAFADIDSQTWHPVINDGKEQWEDFKGLKDVKRIISLGGWAYSTEPATYNIIRRAIIEERETFATNLAKFVNEQGIDGVDIDWEYPGAPDIEVNGQPIGQKTDGNSYLQFLTVLKKKLGPDKSVSIAAPASFWYLKAFPIDRIASVIDYIVYMTYDLHGQWDYGNPNAFDQCASGKCIRSHVNLTETRNTLVMITKAGVPNNKVFVGEASYGRSFHMAKDKCWGPMCEFTGSRTQSDAHPGRCTKTNGYLSYAEIIEILKSGNHKTFHDGESNTDVVLYNGDYVSYMTSTTKDTRRADWKSLNFAGTIDWAVDLQRFTDAEKNHVPERRASGDGCISGRDIFGTTGELCEFTCSYGYCPESLCICSEQGKLKDLPPEKGVHGSAWDYFDLDLNRLCAFSCRYGDCPEDICDNGVKQAEEDNVSSTIEELTYQHADTRYDNDHSGLCYIFDEPDDVWIEATQCKKTCQVELDQAAEENRVTNYGCMGFFPLDKPIPWATSSGVKGRYAPGKCLCDNPLMNIIAETVLEAMPVIAATACHALMSSVKLVVELGARYVPVVGPALDAGLHIATTAAQMAAYLYPEGEKPEEAFDWWMSPCKGLTHLVPEEVKKVFDTLSRVSEGATGFAKPKPPRGSGKKGDSGNPLDQSKPRVLKIGKNGKHGKSGGGNDGGGGGGGKKNKKKCSVPAQRATRRMGQYKNTIRRVSCVNDATKTNDYIVSSLIYHPRGKETTVAHNCPATFTQACYHYSSAIRVSPQWSNLACPTEAARPNWRLDGHATSTWLKQHHSDWRQTASREYKSQCDMDEYPPAYLLSPKDRAYRDSGAANGQGQLVRYLPGRENQKAGNIWKGFCFAPWVKELSETELVRQVKNAKKKQVIPDGHKTQNIAAVTVFVQPTFSWGSWGHNTNPLPNDGLDNNKCWPTGMAPKDPGFALLTYDPYYRGHARPYDFQRPYDPPRNGV